MPSRISRSSGAVLLIAVVALFLAQPTRAEEPARRTKHFSAPIKPSAGPVSAELFHDSFDDEDAFGGNWTPSRTTGRIILRDGVLELGNVVGDLFSVPRFGRGVRASARMMIAGDYQKFGFVIPNDRSAMQFYFDSYEDRGGKPSRDFVRAVVLRHDGEDWRALLETPVPAKWGVWHEFAIERRQDGVVWIIDGREVARFAEDFDAPLSLIFMKHRPGEARADWVRVESLKP